MANEIGEAFIKIRPDADDFESETEGKISKLGSLGANTAKVAATAAAATGAAAVAWGTQAVFAASDTEEALSKVGAVFGDNAGSVIDFATDANNTLLLSEEAALSAVGGFGNLLTSFGLSSEASGDMSTELLTLAQDLASFNNISVDEAIEKLNGGLVGEADGLKSLGAGFTSAELAAKGLELGLTDSEGSLDAAGKAQAAYALIMEKTANAQGDVERTSGGLANQMRTLQGDIADLLADVGSELAPFATELIGVFKEAFGVIGPLLGQLAATLGPILTDIVGKLAPVISTLVEGLQPAFEAIGELIVNLPWDALTEALTIVLTAIASILPPLVDVFSPILALIATLLPPIAELLAGLAEAVVGLVAPIAEALMPVLDTLIGIFVDEIMPILLDDLVPLIALLASSFGEILAEAITALAPILVELLEAFIPILPVLIDLLENILPVVIALFEEIVPVLTDVIVWLASLQTEFVDKLFPVFETLGEWLADVGGWFVDLWEDTLKPFVDDVGDFAQDIADFFVGLWEDTLSPWVDDISAMVEDVLGFFGDMSDGISDIVDDIVGFFTGIAKSIGDAFSGAVSGIKSAWNNGPGGFGFTIPGWVPGIGGNSFTIPSLFTGGLVNQAMIAQIGDRPGGEAVLTAPDVREIVRWAGVDGGSGGGGGGGIRFEGPVTFGSDMKSATDELTWMTQYSLEAA